MKLKNSADVVPAVFARSSGCFSLSVDSLYQSSFELRLTRELLPGRTSCLFVLCA